MHGHSESYSYTTIEGFFEQDDMKPAVAQEYKYNDETKIFGLKPIIGPVSEADSSKPKTDWQKFDVEVDRLQREPHHKVKVLFLGRHGDGVHNQKEKELNDSKQWDELSKQEGDWSDAHLTPKGERDAKDARDHWNRMIREQKISQPGSFYVSPLWRCLQTAYWSFTGVDWPRTPSKIIIKEYLREGLNPHTCDRRSTKAEIHAAFPTFEFEPGFTEEDEMWKRYSKRWIAKPGVKEGSKEQHRRSRDLLNDIFANSESRYVSITSHAGEIDSLLHVMRHKPFRLQTGQVVPVLVRAQKDYVPDVGMMLHHWEAHRHLL